jgi:hypothetical protein
MSTNNLIFKNILFYEFIILEFYRIIYITDRNDFI